MKFVCLVHVDGDAMAALTPEESARLTDETIAEDWDLRERGQLIMAQPLDEPGTAVVIRSRNGKISRTDGPYAETKEFLGGFFVIDARDLEEAVAIAQTSAMARYGSIEVRPALEQTDSQTGRGRPEAEAVTGVRS